MHCTNVKLGRGQKFLSFMPLVWNTKEGGGGQIVGVFPLSEYFSLGMKRYNLEFDKGHIQSEQQIPLLTLSCPRSRIQLTNILLMIPKSRIVIGSQTVEKLKSHYILNRYKRCCHLHLMLKAIVYPYHYKTHIMTDIIFLTCISAIK